MAMLGLLLLTLFSAEIQASSVHHIVNGELATECEFPHLAFLYIQKGEGTFSCGGSLLDETHIVTAAHCVDGDIKRVFALFGSLDVRSMHDVIPVATYTQHSGFHQSRASVYDDVAILKLSRPVKFNGCRKPIRMVKLTEKIYGDQCTIAGWGKTSFESGPSNLLRRADVPIMPLKYCAKNVPGITVKHVCVGNGIRYGKSACKGDSGGPLMCTSADNGERVLVGLVSYGWTCREGLGIFTSVRYYHDWIAAQINN